MLKVNSQRVITISKLVKSIFYFLAGVDVQLIREMPVFASHKYYLLGNANLLLSIVQTYTIIGFANLAAQRTTYWFAYPIFFACCLMNRIVLRSIRKNRPYSRSLIATSGAANQKKSNALVVTLFYVGLNIPLGIALVVVCESFFLKDTIQALYHLEFQQQKIHRLSSRMIEAGDIVSKYEKLLKGDVNPSAIAYRDDLSLYLQQSKFWLLEFNGREKDDHAIDSIAVRGFVSSLDSMQHEFELVTQSIHRRTDGKSNYANGSVLNNVAFYQSELTHKRQQIGALINAADSPPPLAVLHYASLYYQYLKGQGWLALLSLFLFAFYIMAVAMMIRWKANGYDYYDEMLDEREYQETQAFQSIKSQRILSRESNPAEVAVEHEDNVRLKEELLQSIERALAIEFNNLDLLIDKAQILSELGRKDEELRVRQKIQEIKARIDLDNNAAKRTYLEEVSIQDWCLFGSFKWELRPGTNVLLGKNGYGKSHLLSLIIAAIQNNENVVNSYLSNMGRKYQLKIKVKQENTIKEILFSAGSQLNNPLGKIPVLAISELRFINKSSQEITPLSNEVEIGDLKSEGAYHFLNRLSLGGILNNFLLSLCITYFESNNSFSNEIFRLLEDVVGQLTNATFKFEKIERLGITTTFRIWVKTEGNEEVIPIQYASQGTLSLLSIIGLIYTFLHTLNTSDKRLFERDAIIFIDEIDAHLHPSWQQKIINILRRYFPNVQFIITGHSPLIVAGCKEKEVSVLRKKSNGFELEQLRRHFIGVKATELYDSVFEIEEKDESYLKYAALKPFKNDFIKEMNAIRDKNKLAPEDLEVYEELRDKQDDFENRVNIAASLLRKEKLSSDELRIMDRICESAGLDGSTPRTIENLKAKLSLTPEEEKKLQELEEKQVVEESVIQRLDELYDRIHYINELEKSSKEKSEKYNEL